MISFLKTVIYEPLYNILVLILGIPYVDAGIAVIILTLFVKIVLYPLSKKATQTQIVMKEKESELKEIREKYKDKQEQAIKTMEFYRQNNINPFSSILTILIQIPIIYALYHIFLKSGLPLIQTDIVYSFVKIPSSVSMKFLGFFDISTKSILLAILAAVTTFIQLHLSSKSTTKISSDPKDLSSMMMNQMKYTFPIVVFFISWSISGVVALYWFVSNVLGILQDRIIRKNLNKN